MARRSHLRWWQPKLEEHGLEGKDRLKPIKPRDVVTVGDFKIEFLRVTHSMPDCVAVAFHTPVGIVIHTGDFKVDQTPIDGEQFDFHRFAELGSQGVLALFADSTNIDRKGFTRIRTGSRGCVRGDLHRDAGQDRRRDVLVEHLSHAACWSTSPRSSIGAWRSSAAAWRRIREIAQRLGYLRIPAGVQMRDSDVRT